MFVIYINAALTMSLKEPKKFTRGQVFRYLRRRGLDVIEYA